MAPHPWLLPSRTQPSVWEPGTEPLERGRLKVSRHEQIPDGDWQATDPEAAGPLSGCHSRAKERRRHRIKGQRTPRVEKTPPRAPGPPSTRVRPGNAVALAETQTIRRLHGIQEQPVRCT
ncbi:Interactor Of Hormad1 Protein 1 [Manis pentadactyla]|nr:Interactor Of Hormad1 Protein 1 [Manis pentadactyla]